VSVAEEGEGNSAMAVERRKGTAGEGESNRRGKRRSNRREGVAEVREQRRR
jgi:hypothetical protein